MELKGHAGTAPRGQDLVCAAVTALISSYGAYIQWLSDRDCLRREPEILLEPGYARILAQPVSGCLQQWQGAWGMLTQGLAHLAQAHPEQIRLEGR